MQVAPVEDEVTALDFGSLLKVKPLISPDGTIALNFKSTLSDFVGNLDVHCGLRLNQHDLETTVTFTENDTVVAPRDPPQQRHSHHQRRLSSKTS